MAQFAKLVPPDVINEILAHPDDEWPSARKLFIGHMIIQARDDDLAALERLIPQIIDVILQYQGTMDNLNSSLITVVFGTPVSTSVSPSIRCQDATNALIGSIGNNIKIIYGSGEALVGSWGHPQFCVYGARLPAFSQRLQKLCEMSYGEIAEINL